MVSERTQQIRTALALVIGAALVDRVFLHLLNITPAALIACVLVAVTLAAGVRRDAVIRLALMWWAWTAVCLADLLALHIDPGERPAMLPRLPVQRLSRGSGSPAAIRKAAARQSTALVPASHDVAVIVLDREAA